MTGAPAGQDRGDPDGPPHPAAARRARRDAAGGHRRAGRRGAAVRTGRDGRPGPGRLHDRHRHRRRDRRRRGDPRLLNFAGSGCDANRIWWVGGSGSSWKAERTPYLGRVLASDQSSGAFVLYAASGGIFLGERTFGSGAYLLPARQLSSTAPGAVAPQGALLAGGHNTWWAVWSEQVGPGGEFAQTELFQAKTYGGALTRTRVTFNPDNDHQPALAFRPGGGGELAFVRDNGFGDEPTHSYLRLATAPGTSGTWTGHQLATVGINTDPSIDTTPSTLGHTYVAWLRNGQVFETDDRSGGFQARAFVAQGRSTDVNVAGGRTRVVWSEQGDGTVLAERLGGGGWTKGTVYPAASRLRPIVLGTTVLMASARRIYARSERL